MISVIVVYFTTKVLILVQEHICLEFVLLDEVNAVDTSLYWWTIFSTASFILVLLVYTSFILVCHT